MLKGMLWLVFLLTLVYLRLLRRRRGAGRTCPCCGRPDPDRRTR
jgi:hypothetical protein